ASGRPLSVPKEVPLREPILCLSLLALTLSSLPAGAAPERGWPSVESQLAADQVPAGSAAARLIEENQDFGLLRSEEAADRLPVPAWLRVLWRKSHPDAAFPAADPTGGYPFVLKEVHEWMVA